MSKAAARMFQQEARNALRAAASSDDPGDARAWRAVAREAQQAARDAANDD